MSVDDERKKPAIDWHRIDTDDRYLGSVFFAAWYRREEEPIEFAMLCGLVAGRLCSRTAAER